MCGLRNIHACVHTYIVHTCTYTLVTWSSKFQSCFNRSDYLKHESELPADIYLNKHCNFWENWPGPRCMINTTVIAIPSGMVLAQHGEGGRGRWLVCAIICLQISPYLMSCQQGTISCMYMCKYVVAGWSNDGHTSVLVNITCCWACLLSMSNQVVTPRWPSQSTIMSVVSLAMTCSSCYT